MNTIIQTIQKRLAESNQFKYIDDNWGQLDYYASNPPVKFPCAIIAISDLRFENKGRDITKTPQSRQMATVTVDIHIAKLRLTNSSLKAPQMQKIQALSIWQLIEEVHQLLHGWKPTENASSLIRESVNQSQRSDGVQEFVVRYTFEIYDA